MPDFLDKTIDFGAIVDVILYTKNYLLGQLETYIVHESALNILNFSQQYAHNQSFAHQEVKLRNIKHLHQLPIRFHRSFKYKHKKSLGHK